MNAVRRLVSAIRWRSRALLANRPRIIEYRSFRLCYMPMGVYADVIKGGWIYEREISRAIVEEIRAKDERVFVDVGAHIGLVTLNVLAEVPNVRVFAFEPGPRQCFFLRRTLRANGLEERVMLKQVALGQAAGRQDFVCQRRFPSVDYSMGDGLRNTRRWGKRTKTIKVDVATLDGWWESAGRPHVGVIKVDTEGSELWVLRGGEKVLARRRPTVFLEVQPQNLVGYPYDQHDILRWLNEHEYQLETLDGATLTHESLDDRTRNEEMFKARPRGE